MRKVYRAIFDVKFSVPVEIKPGQIETYQFTTGQYSPIRTASFSTSSKVKQDLLEASPFFKADARTPHSDDKRFLLEATHEDAPLVLPEPPAVEDNSDFEVIKHIVTFQEAREYLKENYEAKSADTFTKDKLLQYIGKVGVKFPNLK